MNARGAVPPLFLGQNSYDVLAEMGETAGGPEKGHGLSGGGR